MSRGLYLPGDSFFHRLRPPVKLAVVLLSFVPPLVLVGPRALGVLAALGVALVLSCGAGRALWKVRALVALLVVMSLLLWPLFRASGPTLLAVGPIAVTRGGVLYGLTVALRLLCFLFGTLLLVSTTTVEEFAFALGRLGVPFRAAFSLSLAFRLVPLFMETGRTIVAAQRARGLELDAGGVVARARKYVPILVPILLGAIRKADRMAVALEARGFGAPGIRTSLADRPATWRDAVAVAAVVLVLAASVAMRWPALAGC
jgi:energy-coupling factor transport system permease protein